MRSRNISAVGTYAIALIIVAVCALTLRVVPFISAGAAAPVLLLAVLFISRAWGTVTGLAASAAAAFGFIYFFLPPAGGLVVRDPNDWVAFITFTVSAIVVGELSARAERRQLEAEEGRREIEQLYQQLTAAFERASEAEAARRNEQLKAALLDALRHNLRTPLTAIKAAVTALIGAAPDSNTVLSRESRRDLLEVIDEESDRLNRFIEGLSAVDRPEQIEPAHGKQAELALIVREAMTRADSVLRHHRTQVTIEPSLPHLAVESAAIAEVVYMLLDNASKYAPTDTLIRIEGHREDERQIRLTVADEGPGIPAELRERVFERFFRVPGRPSIDTRRSGIGLGLSIARRLVESQAGRIWIEESSSGGTSVVLTLPVGVSTRIHELVDAPVAVRT